MARSFRRRLQQELTSWVADGLIAQEQADALRRRYSVRKRSDLALRIAAVFGTLLVGAGATLLVAANWGSTGSSLISSPLKVAGVALLMVGAFAGGYWLSFQRALPRVGRALILVGSALFLADLALITQQYNIEANPAILFLLLFLSAVPLMYALRSREYAVVAPAALAVWLGLLLVDDTARFYAMDEAFVFSLAFVGIGSGILAVGLCHRLTRWKRLAPPMEWLGGAVVIAAVFYLGFYRHDPPLEPAGAWLVACLLLVPDVLVAATCVLGLRRLSRTADKGRFSAATVGATALVATVSWSLAVAVSPHSDRFGESEGRLPVWTVGFWVLEVWLLIALSWLGFAFGRAAWTWAAVAALGAFLLARYFDLFGGSGLRGVVFMLAGVLLLAIVLALEWRGRRQPSRASSAT